MRRFKETEIQEMAKVLKDNGVISVPTDTVYGVCAIATSQVAQDNLRKVKNRPVTKAFPIMCSDSRQVEEIAEVTERERKILQEFMPGPLTLILKKKESVPEYVNGGMDTLAVRLATSDVLKQLIQTIGAPLFMTSANQSGCPECKNLDEIEAQCPLLSGMLEGNVSFGQASTIIDCTKEELKVLRQGPVTLEEIEEKLK